MVSSCRTSGSCLAVGLLLLGGFSWAYAQPSLPPDRYAERLTFDKETETWSRTPPPVPGSEDGDLDIARQWMARQVYDKAKDILEEWLDSYDEISPRYPEAVYLEAVCELEEGDYYDAHKGFQLVLNDYPGSAYAERALSGDFRVAEQYLAGKRRKAWKGFLWIQDRDAGLEIMDDIIANYSDTPFALLAHKAKADYYYQRGEFELAEDEYAIFAAEFPRSRYHSYALLQSARAAMASFPGVQFDDAALIEARVRFLQVKTQYPGVAAQSAVPILLEEIDARRAEKALEIGKFYAKTDQPSAARFYYRETIERYPETPAAAEAESRLRDLQAELEVDALAFEEIEVPATAPAETAPADDLPEGTMPEDLPVEDPVEESGVDETDPLSGDLDGETSNVSDESGDDATN